MSPFLLRYFLSALFLPLCSNERLAPAVTSVNARPSLASVNQNRKQVECWLNLFEHRCSDTLWTTGNMW
jgi:hypothetical protein